LVGIIAAFIMRGKRELLAKLCSVAGFTAVCEQWRKRPALIVLNYHRIGDSAKTQYDPGVFSATAEGFAWQIRYLKQHFEIATLDDAVAMINRERSLQPSVLITFDDGYLDNYEIAFPILRDAGVPATFFLPTAFVGSNRLPWWDLIAYIVKNGKSNRIRLSYPHVLELDLTRQSRAAAAVDVLRAYKHPDMQDHDRFIGELLQASESGLPTAGSEVCFLNWQQAREMQAAGMTFGSHTHNHEVLSKLSAERQHEELKYSREILERELNCRITTLAYPVGGGHAFSRSTQEIARRCGYRSAFSFYGGFNLTAEIQPYDVRRFGLEGQSHPRFRLQMALGSASGTTWV
jgi:peptidoglycan/xylan/chitin deacetylase (PgdA/CDA1 family)